MISDRRPAAQVDRHVPLDRQLPVPEDGIACDGCASNARILRQYITCYQFAVIARQSSKRDVKKQNCVYNAVTDDLIDD